ncbi:MAG: cupin domain-containing protein [Desulfovibrio sp.]|jgi:mannose-6-phosphate isomerase-like protein (cupin superfamily)|nr:cupin domain-containing protein [Desulfovibrio sp.]
MIRKASEATVVVGQKFSGPGEAWSAQILNEGEFAGKGRLFNYMVLKPGVGVGKHRHSGDFEAYYILEGEGRYDDNGKEVVVGKGDITICHDGEEHAIYNAGPEDLKLVALILFTGK